MLIKLMQVFDVIKIKQNLEKKKILKFEIKKCVRVRVG